MSEYAISNSTRNAQYNNSYLPLSFLPLLLTSVSRLKTDDSVNATDAVR